MIALALAALALSVQDPEGDRTAELARLIAENLRPVTIEQNALAGPGAKFLIEEAGRAQFVALGERHFNADIPSITTLLFLALQKEHGFQYLAVENGPVATRRLVEKPYRADLQQTVGYLKRFPFAIAFNSDQDLAMMVDVTRASKARGRPLWGVDQEFGVLHVLEELDRTAKTPAQRQAVERLRSLSKGAESKRDSVHFLSGASTQEQFEQLRKEFSPGPGSFEDFAIRQMALSQEIYSYYRRAEQGEPVGRLNNYVREENMKDLFMEEYRYAQQRGDRLPKAVLKYGQWHLYRGLSPGSIFPLGNFVSEFAKSNGMESLHVFFTVRPPHEELAKDEWAQLRPFFAAAQEGWALIDMRPLRNYWHAGRIPSINAEFRRLIFGYDFVFVMNENRPATTMLTDPPK
jgi:hypothetical protein